MSDVTAVDYFNMCCHQFTFAVLLKTCGVLDESKWLPAPGSRFGNKQITCLRSQFRLNSDTEVTTMTMKAYVE